MAVVLKALVCLMSAIVLLCSAGLPMPVRDEGQIGRLAATDTWLSDVECVRLAWSEYDLYVYPVEIDCIDVCEIHSNGTLLSYSEFDTHTTQQNDSCWESVPDDVFDQVLAAMEDEGFGSMDERYFDPRTSLAVPSTYTLTAVGSSSGRSVVFEGETVAGLMPLTYCLVLSAGYEGVSVDLSVVELSPLLYEISCVVRNDRDVSFAMTACTEDIWYFSVMRDNGCRFNERPTTFPNSIITVPAHQELVFTPKLFNASGLPNGSYSVLVDVGPIGVAPLVVDGNDAYINTPPLDRGSRTSSDSSGVCTIELVGCCDLEDRQEDILVRWDWGSDGVWDSDWSSEKSFTHTYEEQDDVDVTYELEDTDGAVTVGTVSISVDVSESEAVAFPLVAAVGAALAVVVVVLAVIILMRRRDTGQ